jgi:hypothetical protein
LLESASWGGSHQTARPPDDLAADILTPTFAGNSACIAFFKNQELRIDQMVLFSIACKHSMTVCIHDRVVAAQLHSPMNPIAGICTEDCAAISGRRHYPRPGGVEFGQRAFRTVMIPFNFTIFSLRFVPLTGRVLKPLYDHRIPLWKRGKPLATLVDLIKEPNLPRRETGSPGQIVSMWRKSANRPGFPEQPDPAGDSLKMTECPLLRHLIPTCKAKQATERVPPSDRRSNVSGRFVRRHGAYQGWGCGRWDRTGPSDGNFPPWIHHQAKDVRPRLARCGENAPEMGRMPSERIGGAGGGTWFTLALACVTDNATAASLVTCEAR